MTNPDLQKEIEEVQQRLARAIQLEHGFDVRFYTDILTLLNSQQWISVDTPPKFYEAVLTHHVDDVYPVAGYLLEAGIWHRLSEGPEDLIIGASHDPLYRSPTHWMPLPAPPQNTTGVENE